MYASVSSRSVQRLSTADERSDSGAPRLPAGRSAGRISASLGGEHRLLDDVQQLAHVAGPGVVSESALGLLREAARRTIVGARGARGETAGERKDVLRPVGEPRQPDRDDVDPVEEIVAKSALLDETREVAPRGDDQARAERVRRHAREPAEVLLLEDAQELGLRRRRQRGDLVEIDGAVLGDFEQALLGGDRAGEGAALVAEELAFEELVGEVRGVHPDEGARGARRRRRGWRGRGGPFRCRSRPGSGSSTEGPPPARSTRSRARARDSASGNATAGCPGHAFRHGKPLERPLLSRRDRARGRLAAKTPVSLAASPQSRSRA